jgi:hypothetical protein
MCIPFSVGATKPVFWNPRHRLRKPDNREKATAPEGQMYFATSRRLRSTMERTGIFSMVENVQKGKAKDN